MRVHNTRPSAALGGRSAAVPCGQCLGGGGSVNCMSVRTFRKTKENFTNGAGGCIRYPWYILIVMMYTRASASDYDDWEKVHENPGWGSNDLIPLLRKVFTPYIVLALLYTYSVRLSPVPACRQRRTKFPMSGRRTEQTARSRYLQVRESPILENNFSKLRAHLIPPVQSCRLTPIRTICRRSMYTPWVF